MDKTLSKIQKNNQEIFGWCLFDFANSIPAVIGGIYFSKWFILDVGASSVTFNLLFLVSGVFLLLFGRKIGKLIDYYGYKKWIIISSLLVFFSLISLYLCSQYLTPQLIIPFSFIFFTLFIIGYQIGRICHNTYLRKHINIEKQSRASGLGAASNWLGSIFGILISIPIISYNPGANGREMTFLLAAIFFFVFTPLSLQMMFKSQKEYKSSNNEVTVPMGNFKIPILSFLPHLFIYFLLFDVMSTVEKNLPTFLSEVHKISDNTQALGFLLILMMAGLGGFFASRTVNRKNSIQWIKVCSLLLAIAIIFLTLGIPILLWVSFTSAGFCYGVLESAIRINYMFRFNPKNAGESFGILSIVERASGVLGPLLWIIPFSFNKNDIAANKYSMLLMSIMSLIAFLMLLKKRGNINNLSD